MSKSYVTLEHHLCLICGKPIETGAILIDRRLQERFDRYTPTGFSKEPCSECEKMLHHEGERIALVACIDKLSPKEPNGSILPQNAHRTGEIVWMRREAWPKIFNIPIYEGKFVFIDEEGVKSIKKIIGQ